MRKSTKIAMLVAAIVLLASMTVAAAGWVQEDGEWYYNDTYGDHVYNTWKSSGGRYYYLGDDGAMVRDRLINDGTAAYYVGTDGARVVNQWVKVEADDTDAATYGVDFRWYYFAANGKAYNNATKTINGKKYRFDTDGKMVYGFTDESYAMITETEDPILSATYYFGGNEDGSLQTGWVQTELVGTTVSGDDYYGDLKWFYFNPTNGKKVLSAVKSIGGIKYEFDDYGIMKTGWSATPSTYSNYNSNGGLQKKTWIYVVPSKDINATDNENETSRWFYVDYAGKTVTDCARSINGKWYMFDENGIMKAGLAKVDGVAADSTIAKWTFAEGMGSKTAQEIIDGGALNLVYLSGDEKNDGSAKTGSVKIELADDTYTFYFKKNFLAANGVANNKLYINGLLQTAGDQGYTIIENKYGAVGEFDYYLVNAVGTIFKTSTVVRDVDEVYYALNKKDDSTINWAKIAPGDYASAAANYFKTHGNLDDYNHKANVTVIDSGVFATK